VGKHNTSQCYISESLFFQWHFTKWPEAVALKRVDTEELIKFLKHNILSRFGVPEKFITDNGSIFIGSKFTKFGGEYGIVMG
jgi:hypothetical protein